MRITDFSITEEAFDPTLNPIRAKVSLGMRVLSVNDLGFDHKGGNLFMTYLQKKEQLAARSASAALSTLGITGISMITNFRTDQPLLRRRRRRRWRPDGKRDRLSAAALRAVAGALRRCSRSTSSRAASGSTVIAHTHSAIPSSSGGLCDANGAMRPDELTETIGRRLRITLPEGIPGTPRCIKASTSR